jgi:hypothetical protein
MSADFLLGSTLDLPEHGRWPEHSLLIMMSRQVLLIQIKRWVQGPDFWASTPPLNAAITYLICSSGLQGKSSPSRTRYNPRRPAASLPRPRLPPPRPYRAAVAPA